MSLFTRFFLLLLAVSLGPLVVVGVWVLRSDEAVRENVRAFHTQTVAQAADSLEVFAAEVNRSLGFVLELDRAFPKGRAEEFKILQRAAADPRLVLLSVAGPDGVEYLRVADDRVFPPAGYQDRSGEETFRRVRQSGRAAFGPVEFGRGVPVLPLVYPLAGDRILVAGYGLERLWERLGRQRVGKTGRLLLADARGRLLPGQQGSAEGEPSPPLPRDSGWLDDPGLDWVGAYQRAPSLGWYALSRQARPEAYLRSGTFHLKLLAGLVGLGLLVVFTSAAVTRRIAAPIQELSGGALRVAASDFSRPVREIGWTELRSLSRVFNQMMGKLREYQEFHLDQLLAEKAKIETLVNSIPDGIVLANLRGELEFINRLGMAILRLTPSEARRGNRPLHELISQHEFNRAFSRMLQKRSPSELIEMPIDGRTRLFNSRSVLCANPGGREVGVLLVMQDVTLETELDRMKEDFFHSIVHDLRSPLGAIKGFMDFLTLRGMFHEKAAPYLPAIRSACDTLGSLIQDILDVARLEAGEVRLKLSMARAPELLERVRTLFALQAEKDKKALRWEAPAPVPDFSADPDLLERVLMNLTGNAMKFTPPEGAVTLRARGGDGWVEFSVSDTGPGIPRDKLDEVFEKFKQLDTPRGGRRAGYGLGLSICKRVVELHGGRIWVESKPGEGASFVFRLPLRPAAAAA